MVQWTGISMLKIEVRCHQVPFWALPRRSRVFTLPPSGQQLVMSSGEESEHQVWVSILLILLSQPWHHSCPPKGLSNHSFFPGHFLVSVPVSGLGVGTMSRVTFKGTHMRHRGFLTACPSFCRRHLYYSHLWLAHLNVPRVSSLAPSESVVKGEIGGTGH